MTLVDKPNTEQEWRGQVARLEQVIARNPAMASTLSAHLRWAQKELDLLLLSTGQYKLVKVE